MTGDVNAPEAHEAGRVGGTNPRGDRYGDNVEGKDPMDRNRRRTGLGAGRLRLPAEYADFILADGRRLEDVLGKSFFQGFEGGDGRGGREGREGRAEGRERRLAERRAQAGRLNETKAILTGVQGAGGPANIARRDLSGG